MKYDVDHYSRVFELREAEYYEVGPDCDGLGCVAITFVGPKNERKELITLPPEMALLIATELEKHAKTLIEKSL